MSTFEDNLQLALRELADDVGPEPALRWVGRPAASRFRRPLLVGLAAAVVVLVAVASLALPHPHGARIVDPVQAPPKVFRLSGETSTAPGKATMAVTLTDASAGGAPVYLVSSVDGAIRSLRPSPQVYPVESQRLAAGGLVLVRKNQDLVGPAYVLVDLASGRLRPIDDKDALFLTLSPDGRTAAEYTSRDVRLRSLATGARHVLRRLAAPTGTSVVGIDHPGSSGVIGAIGWAPAGDVLAMHDGPDTLVVDRNGELLARLRGARLVNGSQSWSPDGSRLLVYAGARGRFQVREADGTGSSALPAPRGGLRPLGWAGSRVVWLTGVPDRQRLVTCRPEGDGCQIWMRFEVGGAGVEGVTWSSDLAGTSRP